MPLARSSQTWPSQESPKPPVHTPSHSSREKGELVGDKEAATDHCHQHTETVKSNSVVNKIIDIISKGEDDDDDVVYDEWPSTCQN